MYHPNIMDHYHAPRNKGVIQSPDVDATSMNPLCGDAVRITGIVSNDGIIQDIAFEGSGCVLSMAAASIICDAAVTKSYQEILLWDAQMIMQMINMPLGPVRLRCALLPLQTLKKGIQACLIDRNW